MSWLIILGVIVTCFGLGFLLYTIGHIWQAKRDKVSNEEMKAQLRKAVLWNFIAMGCSGLGLMIVVLGVTF